MCLSRGSWAQSDPVEDENLEDADDLVVEVTAESEPQSEPLPNRGTFTCRKVLNSFMSVKMCLKLLNCKFSW